MPNSGITHLHCDAVLDIRHESRTEKNMLHQFDNYVNTNWDLLLWFFSFRTEFDMIAAAVSV